MTEIKCGIWNCFNLQVHTVRIEDNRYFAQVFVEKGDFEKQIEGSRQASILPEG